jgi:hypothetical protein
MSAICGCDSLELRAATIVERGYFVHEYGRMAALADEADLGDKSLIYR